VVRIGHRAMAHYPLYSIKGDARELGRQHGEFARTKIASLLGFLCEQLKKSPKQIEQAAALFRSQFELHCPTLIPEINGLAEGAGITFELALACQLRGELAQTADGACTTFAVGSNGTSDGKLLVGQTSDMATEIRDFGYVLHVKPENRPQAIMWTFGGMIGYHGLNEHGVCHFANSLGGGPDWKMAPSHYPLKRLILEKRNLTEVRELFRTFPVCSSGNYMLSDATDILDVEQTPAGTFPIEEDGTGFLAHSNHYLCSEHGTQANFDKSLPDSFNRLDRMRALIADSFGSIDVDTMKTILSDHDGHPVSICRHPHDGFSNDILPNTGHTAAAIIAEPNAGRIHVSAGNPCEVPFHTYSLD
jgi:isopenicillin-N N-acyltransferase like protein